MIEIELKIKEKGRKEGRTCKESSTIECNKDKKQNPN